MSDQGKKALATGAVNFVVVVGAVLTGIWGAQKLGLLPANTAPASAPAAAKA